MNFAPYQDESPDANRTLSPPPSRASPRSPRPGGVSKASTTDPWAAARPPNTLPSPDDYADLEGGDGEEDPHGGLDPHSNNYGNGNGNSNSNDGAGLTGGVAGMRGYGGSRNRNMDAFETSLPLRMDWEACAAYLLLPPAGGVLLLLLEHKSDYVRFHAWQSSLLFAFLFVIHLIFSWTAVVSWLLFAVDVALIAWLTMRAYRDADTLDRCEVPFFGPLASSILDDE
ncbi:hypothetical protein BJ546DRAFT_688864 [Cryomyces antarcticus]